MEKIKGAGAAPPPRSQGNGRLKRVGRMEIKMVHNIALNRPQSFGIKERRLLQLARGNARLASLVASGCGLLALRHPAGQDMDNYVAAALHRAVSWISWAQELHSRAGFHKPKAKKAN